CPAAWPTPNPILFHSRLWNSRLRSYECPAIQEIQLGRRALRRTVQYDGRRVPATHHADDPGRIRLRNKYTRTTAGLRGPSVGKVCSHTNLRLVPGRDSAADEGHGLGCPAIHRQREPPVHRLLLLAGRRRNVDQRPYRLHRGEHPSEQQGRLWHV